jgi:[ribosomal protein S5]-alanine N-acetyltransferase
MSDRDCTLRTARLILRPIELLDVDPLHRVSNEPGVRRYLFDDERVTLEFIAKIRQQSIADFDSRGFGIWIIRENGCDEIIGFCGLRTFEDFDEVEILYGLSESKWNLGYAIEAARAVERYAFEHAGLARLIGVIDRPNLTSWRVLEKLGMREYQPEIARSHLRYAIITRHQFKRAH